MSRSEAVRARVVAGLDGALAGLDDGAIPRPEWRGSLSRPALALGVARRVEAGPALPGGFWPAALAIQLTHEASLVHDDIVDHASYRRGAPSFAARHGVELAVLHGDHLLTTAYRAAAATGSFAFVSAFADAIAAMVAAERWHFEAGSRPLSDAEYVTMVEGKTGALLGLALAAAPILVGDGRAPELVGLGRRAGVIYQRVDDLIDYCPGAETGKPAFADRSNGRWTWVLGHSPTLRQAPDGLGGPAPQQASSGPSAEDLFRGGAESAMRRALDTVRRDAGSLRADLRRLVGGLPPFEDILDRWVSSAEVAIDAAERRLASAGPPRAGAA